MGNTANNENLGNQPSHYSYDPDKPLQVGGQAVVEGVMMRAPGRIATAVRRSNGEIVVRTKEFKSLTEKYAIFKLPVLRGAVGLVEMMVVGIETLNFSGEVAMQDMEETGKNNGKSVHPKKTSGAKLALTVIFALLVGIGVFFITPLIITTKLFNVEQQAFWFNLITGGIRLAILLIYLIGISMMQDVKRLFQYHGAEHKAVFTFESRAELSIPSAMHYTRFHPRCGTSFILIVVLAAMLLFSLFDSILMLFIGKLTLPIRLLTHLPLIPVVGGIAYEFIRWSARRSDTRLGKILVAPGLWLQKITTQEPDPSQLEVALVAIRCALGIASPVAFREVQQISELAA